MATVNGHLYEESVNVLLATCCQLETQHRKQAERIALLESVTAFLMAENADQASCLRAALATIADFHRMHEIEVTPFEIVALEGATR